MLCGAVNNVLSIDILYIGNSSCWCFPYIALASKYDPDDAADDGVQAPPVDIKKSRPFGRLFQRRMTGAPVPAMPYK